MFHLLISYSGWPSTGGSMSNGRIYLRPDTLPGSDFYTDGRLDLNKVNKIPALLVTELNGDGDQFARVAYITSLTPGIKETTIQYAIDNSIAPISNTDLAKYSAELRLSSFGLSHTCWDLCEVDLFKLLLRNHQNNALTSNVFSLDAAHAQDNTLVSVMMPFRQEFNHIYGTLQGASAELGLNCIRADDIWEENAIIQDVVNLIARARIVICDCSGKNPNVFYEAGIAHAIGKEVILITQSHDDIPFDLRHLRYIYYLSNNEGCQQLAQRVSERIRSILWGTNA